MRISVIGLGRMGANISRRLMLGGHEVVGFDREPDSVSQLVADGAVGAASLEEAAAALASPRIFWVMLPAGAPTEDTIAALRVIAQPGDVVIDGGNSFFKDDVRRARECRERGIHYVDVGTSGGVWGLERGYCLMIGGDEKVVRMLDPVFAALAPGYGTLERTPGRDGRRRPGRARLHPRRSRGRRAFRQDGSQRDRIWPHAGLRRGLRHPQRAGVGQASRGRKVRGRPPRCRRGVAPGIGDLLLAARPVRARAGERPQPRPVFGPRGRQRRRPVDRRRGDGRGGAGRPSSPPHCSLATAAASSRVSPTSSCPRCGSASAATSKCRSDVRDASKADEFFNRWPNPFIPMLATAVFRSMFSRAESPEMGECACFARRQFSFAFIEPKSRSSINGRGCFRAPRPRPAR